MNELDELDFVAVEIHTAGADPASVCAVDMALVRGGEIVAAERWPVRPPTGPTSFSRLHTQLHGVDEAAVADAPEWPEVAAQLDLLGEHLPFVASGADRDRGAYEAATRATGGTPQEHEWRDALALVGRLRPDVAPPRIATAAQALGIPDGGHPAGAGSEAVRTAEVVLALARQSGWGTVRRLWSEAAPPTPDEPIIPESLRRRHGTEPSVSPAGAHRWAPPAPAPVPASAAPAARKGGVGWKLAGTAMVGIALGAALFFVASISVIMEYLGDGRGSDATVGMGIAALCAFLAWWFGKTGVDWIRREDG
ncbi:hypothetical protein [Micrococcus sp. Alg238-R198]|uniref:hypothetical protein n=1 Tax=Micrococcus sp. Alg238-R198 TaxID=2305988 RepID=UPI0013D25424|nr:hypothetical protein [Micrococcus sp. Alg238-R198]